jgi:glycosyltransferase involved in cell wall biosynthesis
MIASLRPDAQTDVNRLGGRPVRCAAGHEVAVFAMADPRNRPSPWSKYFVSHVDFSQPKISWTGIQVLGRMFWSFEAERKMRELLEDFHPDVIHLHNIYHQLSPSILRPMRQSGIPVVQTLHDYALISPNYSLFANGKICEDGKNGNYFSLISHRAIKHSLLASFADVMAYVVTGGSKPYLTTVKQFISPSKFLGHYVQSWLGRDIPVTTLPNFVETIPQSIKKESRLIYVGRLSQEKGVDVLLRAMQDISLPLDIVGTGPEMDRLQNMARALQLRNVFWHGKLQPTEVARMLSRSIASIVPSVWYENYPLSILESLAQGTPVIGSDIGGIPELVTTGVTGELFSAGDVHGLHEALKKVEAHPEEWKKMSEQCQSSVAEKSTNQYIHHLECIYDAVRA